MSSAMVPLEIPVSDSTIPYGRLDLPEVSVPTYKWWSVFNILCCCLPLGLVAVFYSGEVEEQLAKRNLNGAKSASQTARTFNIIALLCGLGAYSYLIYYLVQIYYPQFEPTRAPYIIG